MSGNRKLTVLYGSQTGVAQDFAERIWQDAKRRHFEAEIHSCDDFGALSLPELDTAIFVVATCGQGEEPDNMKTFWRFLLRRDLPQSSLSSLSYACLGLGDSSYLKFNFAAKKLNRRLIQLGAMPLIPVGLADDQHDLGPDGVAEPWIAQLWDTLLQAYPLPEGLEIIPIDQKLPSKYQVVWDDEEVAGLKDELSRSRLSQGSRNSNKQEPFFAELEENQRVTPEAHWQDTRLFSFDISNSGLSYKPGDVAVLLPQNLSETREKFTELMNLGPVLDRKFSLIPSDPCIPLPPHWQLPRGATVRECINSYWDLQCVPRRSFFKVLSQFAENEMEKERLEEFFSPENQDELFSYCNRPRKNVVEVLEDFGDTARRVPFEYLFDLLSSIRPRSFSIASCQEAHGNRLQLLVAVVEYKTRMSTPRKGLCSNWMKRLNVGAKVPLWIRKGTFRFPLDDPWNCIFIGPGTGIAPFRSLAQFSAASVDRNLDGVKPNTLFFGCRNENSDFYFRDEWKELQERDQLVLFTAFSRDQEKKIYVQHRIEENGELLLNMILNGSMIFLAGSSNQMPKNCREAFVDAAKSSGMSPDEAERFIAEMEKSGRFQLETWS